ncbi:MAG: MBL fold metallo-hydrolase [Bullifex sp.]
MKITPMTIGAFATSAYIAESDRGITLIDAPAEAEKIISVLKDREITPGLVILTHGHFDHVLALGKLKAEYPEMKIAISEKDSVYLSDGGERIRGDIALFDTGLFYGRMTSLLPVPAADILLKDGDTIAGFTVMATPGHTKGSICLRSEEEKVNFTGDTLFRGSIGRTDMPGGSYSDICTSLSRLKQLPDDTSVFPGHGASTTLGHEKKYNPYL